MMKKSLKTMGLFAGLAVFGTVGFAQQSDVAGDAQRLEVPEFKFEEGFNATVQGAVRVEGRLFASQKDSVREEAKDDVETIATSTIAGQGGDTYSQVTLNYQKEFTKASAIFRFQGNGEKRVNFAGETTEGDWTGKVSFEYDEFFNADYSTRTTIDTRDRYVSLSDGTITFFLGRKQQFNNYFKGSDYLFNTHYDGINGRDNSLRSHDTGRTIDNRLEGLRFDYAVTPDMSVGLLYSVERERGIFGGVLRALTVPADGIFDIVPTSQTTTTGLFYDAKIAGFDLAFEFGTSEDAGLKTSKDASDLTGDNLDKAKTSGTYMALGVGYDLNPFKIGFNYVNYTEKLKVPFLTASFARFGFADATGDAVDFTTANGYTGIEFNVGYAIDEKMGVALSYSTESHVKPEIKGTSTREGGTAASSQNLEIGFANRLCNIDLKFSYTSATFTEASTLDEIGLTAVTSKWEAGSYNVLRVRAEYAF